MYTSINKGGPSPVASAPPQPSQFEFPPPAIGVPMNPMTNQFNNQPNNNDNTLKSQSPGPWSTGLCDCCEDVNSCCLTCWCPCITFGRIAEIVDRGSTSCGVSGALYTLIMCVTGCACCYSCFYRSKMRGQHFLEESRPCMDCCIHFWCEGCALCQEYRQLKNQGFDMSIGWHGNMERMNRAGVSSAPGVQRGMAR